MKHVIKLIVLSVGLFYNSCTNGQSTGNNLSAIEFSQKIKENPSATVVDVRTPEEFANGHIQNALNIDWRNEHFQNQISKLDKTKPIYVYCLSGGRSAAAAANMRQNGFTQVYELVGGITNWRASSLPEVSNGTSESQGMSLQQYNHIINSPKLVLIDFYAEWCAPCKKMKPYLDEISKDMADKVTVVRIDADANRALAKELKIDALPVLLLYKNNTKIWEHKGFIEKADVVEQLK